MTTACPEAGKYKYAQKNNIYIYIAQQRGAAPCGTVRCRAFALRGGAVSCGAVLSFEHIAVVPGIIQVPGTGMYVCVLVFLLSSVILSSLSVLFAFVFSQITPVLPIRT